MGFSRRRVLHVQERDQLERQVCDPSTHCTVLLGPNSRGERQRIFLLFAPLSKFALQGHTTALPQSAPISNKLRNVAVSALRWCVLLNIFCEKLIEKERLKIPSSTSYKKTRTAEVTICIIPEGLLDRPRQLPNWTWFSMSLRYCHCRQQHIMRLCPRRELLTRLSFESITRQKTVHTMFTQECGK